jgi:hypothetical protein
MRKAVVLVFLLSTLYISSPSTQAQENDLNSVTFTEAYLSAKFQAFIIAPDSPVSSGTLDLRPNQIVLTANATSQQGEDISMTIVLDVQLVNGRLAFRTTSFNLNGMELSANQENPFLGQNGLFGEIQSTVDTAADGLALESLLVNDTSLTCTWQREDPDDPALTIVDNRVSMTMSEDYLNTRPRILLPSDGRLSTVHVDLQPEQMTVTLTQQQADGSSLPVSMTAAPIVYNGLATWSITAMVTGDAAYDASQIGQLNDDIVRSWRAFFGGMYRSSMLADIALTDDSLTLTWDRDLNTGTFFIQNNRAMVITEEYINNSLQVRSPIDYRISNVVVDLQPDQVVITAYLNLPSGKVLTEQATFAATIDDGSIVWTVTSTTLDGTPLDTAIIDRFNDLPTNWLGLGMWEDFSLYDIGEITITDTQIEISGHPR